MAYAWRRLRQLEAIAADIAADGDSALELLSVDACDIAVLDRDIPRALGRRDRQAHRRLRQRYAEDSCSPPPTVSTTRPPGSSSAPTTI
jgi:hypothetical protein